MYSNQSVQLGMKLFDFVRINRNYMVPAVRYWMEEGCTVLLEPVLLLAVGLRTCDSHMKVTWLTIPMHAFTN